MKSLLFIVVVLAIAWFTVPGQAKFDKYLIKKVKDTDKCPGGTRHYSYKIFTINYADYCDTAVKMNKTRTDKYLGLFGTFWKL